MIGKNVSRGIVPGLTHSPEAANSRGILNTVVTLMIGSLESANCLNFCFLHWFVQDHKNCHVIINLNYLLMNSEHHLVVSQQLPEVVSGSVLSFSSQNWTTSPKCRSFRGINLVLIPILILSNNFHQKYFQFALLQATSVLLFYFVLA